MSILDQPIDLVPFLVIDVETTGLDPRVESIVEICAVRVEPGAPPEVLIDTLVDPKRPLAASGIHGVTASDVHGAPQLGDLAGVLESMCAGRVIAGHNVTFDLGFLTAGLDRLGHRLRPPYLCTMRLPGLFEQPANRPLWWACHRNGIPFDGQFHSARGDAVATAALLGAHLRLLRRSGIKTFGELADRARRLGRGDGFTASFDRAPVLAPARVFGASPAPLKPRVEGEAGITAVSAERRYLDVVLRAISHLRIDAVGRDAVAAARQRFGVDAERARRIHGRIIAGAERRYAEDGRVDPTEAAHLDALRTCLAALDIPDPRG